jgi:hypothetical protein
MHDSRGKLKQVEKQLKDLITDVKSGKVPGIDAADKVVNLREEMLELIKKIKSMGLIKYYFIRSIINVSN